MSNFDLRELEVLYQIYLDKKSEDINRYMAKQVEKYTVEMYLTVMMEWDAYYNSYSPVIYKRTGMTERGINPTKVRREGDKFVASVEFDDSMMYHDDNAVRGSQKTYGHSYMMIDMGWSDMNLKPTKYRYAYYEGYGMTARVVSAMKSRLPDWIELEVKINSSKWTNDNAREYRSFN